MNGNENSNTLVEPVPILNDHPGPRTVRTIRNWIHSGRLPAGERLPSETAIAERLGVSRMTARWGIQELEDEGLIRRENRRRFVTDQPHQGSVLEQSIAVLVNGPDDSRLDVQHSSGSEWAIQRGVLAAIEKAQLHALKLVPERLFGDEKRIGLQGVMHGVIALRQATEDAAVRAFLTRLREAGTPVAVYGDAASMPGFDTVVSDHERGAYEVACWLAERGCRRIVQVWGGAYPRKNRPEWLERRNRGYRRAMELQGLEPLPPVELPDGEVASEGMADNLEVRVLAGYLAEQFAHNPPTDALMLISDGLIHSVDAACRLLGRDSDNELMIAGYDNYWSETPEFRTNPIAPAITVDKQNFQIGAALVNLLADRAAGRLPDKPQIRTVPPKLVLCNPGGNLDDG